MLKQWKINFVKVQVEGLQSTSLKNVKKKINSRKICEKTVFCFPQLKSVFFVLEVLQKLFR